MELSLPAIHRMGRTVRRTVSVQEILMKTVIKLMAVISLFPALLLSGCGEGSGSPDGVSSAVALPGSVSLVEDDAVTQGTVTGIVDARLIASMECTGGKAVYVFEGHDVSPDDIDRNEPNPVKSAPVAYDSVSRKYRYTVAPLSEGNYTLAFTCQADMDSPLEDDDIRFGGMKNIALSGGEEVIGHLFM